MITDKQRQRDYEYEADYQSKSRYTTEQWTNILNSGQLDENNISLLKQIYSSFNHAATLLQLSLKVTALRKIFFHSLMLPDSFLVRQTV